MSARVYAVVITWNSASVVRGCLESLRAEGDAISGITVVDNGSEDGSARLVREICPHATLIENNVNLGFAAGANQGITASQGEYILLLNPDISFRPGFTAALVDALEKDPSAGSASPKLVRPGGGTIDSAGLMMRKDRKALDRGRDEPDDGRFDEPCRVFGACGAAALFRRSMLDDVKEGREYFDESFFSYKEDVDLAWRADLLGWNALYVPSAVAEHGRGWKASSRSAVPRFIRRHSHKNRYLTIMKDDDPANLVLHLPHLLLYEVKLFAYALFFEPFLFLAFGDIIRLWGVTMEKRRALMARRRRSPGQMRCLIG
jgi:GT2 family glycosyltransferase